MSCANARSRSGTEFQRSLSIHPLIRILATLSVHVSTLGTLRTCYFPDNEVNRQETQPLEDLDHIQALVNERKRLIAENPDATDELLTPAIAGRILKNRAAVLHDYSLDMYILVAQNPHAQVLIDLCYKRDFRKFPVPIGKLYRGTGM